MPAVRLRFSSYFYCNIRYMLGNKNLYIHQRMFRYMNYYIQ